MLPEQSPIMIKHTLTFAVALLLLTVCDPASSFAQPIQPNIVLIVADDLGWTDLGCTGSRIHQTPAIDSLAKAGMRFNHGYAASANCAPSRACLISGQYVPRHGMTTVAPAARGRSRNRKLKVPEPVRNIPEAPVSLAEMLQAAGYATCVAGKWHVSDDPTQFGFETNFGGNHTGSPKGGYFSPYKNPNLADGPVGEHLPARLAKEVSTWIVNHKEESFFVYLPFYSVHTPIQARKDLTEKYRTRFPELSLKEAKYAAMAESMDLAIGKVLKTLDDHDLSENTVVVFTSDNGPYGPVSNAKPLRGSKGMFYEGGIRVPFIVRWPGHVQPGSTCGTPVINLDLFPTFAKIANTELPKQTIDGVDLTGLLAGEDLKPRDLFWHFPAYLQGYGGPQSPAMQDARNPRWRTTPCSVIRSGDWKLIQYFEDGELELYNLVDDVGEQQNLATQYPEKLAELAGKLRSWQQQTKAQIPSEPNPEFKQ